MVVIMRGVSGGGKSTFARRLREAKPPKKGEQLGELIERANALKGGREIFSADDYFIKPDGTYQFDRNKIADAHAWCLNSFVESGRVETRNLLIVDNTNTTVWEIAPYAAVAKAYGHEVHVVEVDASSYGEGRDGAIVGYSRNVHGVSLETTERQLRNIEQSRKLIKERYGTFHTLRTGAING